jgi:hypothetical protein
MLSNIEIVSVSLLNSLSSSQRHPISVRRMDVVLPLEIQDQAVTNLARGDQQQCHKEDGNRLPKMSPADKGIEFEGGLGWGNYEIEFLLFQNDEFLLFQNDEFQMLNYSIPNYSTSLSYHCI